MWKIIIFVCLITLNLHSQNFEWAKAFNSTNYTYATSITTDNFGNIYSTGYFKGTADFDPGIGVYNLTSTVNNNMFISKLDSDGNFVWAKQITSSSGSMGNHIVSDSNNNLYIVGGYYGLTDFDPSSAVFNFNSVANSLDIFITKYDSNGNLIWAKSLGSPSSEKVYSVCVDIFGNVYTTGEFNGTVDFDPGSETYNLSTLVNSQNIFINKLDSNGNFIWAKSIGALFSYNRGTGIVNDSNGNLYVSGDFSRTNDFDPGINTYNLVSDGSDSDVFILKLDTNGNFVWVKQISGLQQQSTRSIAIDNIDNLYVSGYSLGTAYFDPTGNNLVFNPTGSSYNPFICKLDSLGNLLWLKGFLANTSPYSGGYPNSIKTNNLGEIICTGEFYGAIDFNPSPSQNFNLTSNGSADAFTIKLDSNGDFLFAQKIGATGYDRGNGVAVDSNLNTYTTGTFTGTTDFNPDNNTNFILNPTNNNHDVFIQKMNSNNLSVNENISNDKYRVYPNPTNGLISIDFGNYLDNVSINVKNILGQTILLKKYNFVKNIELSLVVDKGYYFIEIQSRENKSNIKILKI